MKEILLVSFLFLTLVLCFVPLGWGGGIDDINAAFAAYNRGDNDEAIRLYTQAIASGDLSQGDLSIAWNNRGLSWYAKGDYDRAIEDYTKAIELDPKDAYAYYNRGLSWKKKGDNDPAIADYTRAIDLDLKDADVYNNRGNAWMKKGDYDRAIEDYTKAIELDPKDADVYNNLAWLLTICPESKFRDGLKAVKMAKKAVELKRTANHIDTLAAAYAEAGRFHDAIKTEEMAIAKLKEKGNTKDIAKLFEEHLASYKAGKPWREK